MFERVVLHAVDVAATRRFYDALLRTLEIDEWPDFDVVGGGEPTTNLHIGFGAPSRAHVDAFWRAGTEAGYRDDGAPGPRPQYSPDYYGAFLRDPDGNSAEAVHHGSVRCDGIVDHLWIRVGDLDASRRFYEEVGPRAGFMLKDEPPGRAQFAGSSGSFSVVDDTPPTANAHLAFASGGRAVLHDPDGNLVELVRTG